MAAWHLRSRGQLERAMRIIDRKRITRAQEAQAVAVPAPIGGWNARDPLAQMKPTDAVVLENWFPRAADVVTRRGAAAHVTGFSAPVKSLIQYSKADGTTKLFACTDAGVYDATTAGAVGASVASLTNGYVQSVNVSIGGTSYLMLVNGTDKPQLYNGATWTAIDGVSVPAITGITTTDIIDVELFKRRTFFLKKNSMSFYYLPVVSIGGAATEFPMDSLFRLGGYLVAMGTWTIDAGFGMDDHFVLITSEGEVAVYDGTDPSDPAKWSLVGIFYLGKPLGKRCLTKFAGDLISLTQVGAFPLSKGLLSSSVNAKQAITTRIDSAFAAATSAYGSNVGWECLAIPRESMLLFNVPLDSNGSAVQFVMNTVTGAWCKFTNWNARCFALRDDELYFGTYVDGVYMVAKGLTGSSDFGAHIVPYAKQAYNYFGNRGVVKQVTLLRPVFQANYPVTMGLRMDMDFDSPYFRSGLSIVAAAGSTDLWDTAKWDSGVWGGSNEVNRSWRSVTAQPGYCASLVVLCFTSSAQIAWSSTDFKFLIGKGL